MDHATHRIILKCKDELHELMGGSVEPKLVSDRNVSLLSRQMAFHTNVRLSVPISPPPQPLLQPICILVMFDSWRL